MFSKHIRPSSYYMVCLAIVLAAFTPNSVQAANPLVDKYGYFSTWNFNPPTWNNPSAPNPYYNFSGWFDYNLTHEMGEDFDTWWSSMPNNDDLISTINFADPEIMLTILLGQMGFSYYYHDANGNLFAARVVDNTTLPNPTIGNYALVNPDTAMIYYVDSNGVDYISNDGFHWQINDAGVGIQIQGLPPGF